MTAIRCSGRRLDNGRRKWFSAKSRTRILIMSGAGLYPAPLLFFNVLDIYISFWFAMYKRTETKNVSFWTNFFAFYIIYIIKGKQEEGKRQTGVAAWRRRGGNWYLVTNERN